MIVLADRTGILLNRAHESGTALRSVRGRTGGASRPRPWSPLLAMLILALAAPVEAADNPEEEASALCLNDISLGMNSTHGNADTLGLMFGSDLCQKRRKAEWNLDLDVHVVRSFNAEHARDVGRFDFDGSYGHHTAKEWIASLSGIAQTDPAIGLESRLVLAAGLGRELRFGKGTLQVHSGVAWTTEDNRGAAKASFPEAWVKSRAIVNPRKSVSVTETLQISASADDGNDTRVHSKTDLLLRIAGPFAVKSGVEVRWDRRPAGGFDALDVTTHTVFVYSWGAHARGED